MKLSQRILHWRTRRQRHVQLQGEEHEIEQAQRARREAGYRFGESLVKKAGHADNPFMENPHENDENR
jgi:hypothetical protein